MPRSIFALAAGILVLGVLALEIVLRRMNYRRISLERVGDMREAEPPPPMAYSEPAATRIGRWLALAGYRSPGAELVFLGITAGMGLVSLLVALVLRQSGLIEVGAVALEGLPGAIGEMFLPVLRVAPWIVTILLTAVPFAVVQRSRRRIVAEVEQDLPLVLELMSTLSESGLGFDAALTRVVNSQTSDRVLTNEFRAFQREVLAGRPRVEALRELGRRLDISALTIFVSAVIQAEQIGSGVAGVLRRQADEVRERRRERALTVAQSLPVKLLFPLVICFLPAIFVFALGPILLQFFKFADGLINQGTSR